MEFVGFLVSQCKSLFLTLAACLWLIHINSATWVAVEEAQVEQFVFRHVHLLLDQVPRLKQRVELEVKQGIMVRDYYVMFFVQPCLLCLVSQSNQIL